MAQGVDIETFGSARQIQQLKPCTVSTEKCSGGYFDMWNSVYDLYCEWNNPSFIKILPGSPNKMIAAVPICSVKGDLKHSILSSVYTYLKLLYSTIWGIPAACRSCRYQSYNQMFKMYTLPFVLCNIL